MTWQASTLPCFVQSYSLARTSLEEESPDTSARTALYSNEEHLRGVLALGDRGSMVAGEARHCSDSLEVAAAEANNADICTVEQELSNAAIDGTPCIAGGLRSGMGILGWQPLLCPHTLHKDCEGVHSFVIFHGDFC
jgi:hypothetical protein